jgi:2'-5' RNA ligase
MSVLRAFIAIELPKETQTAIQEQTVRLRGSLGEDLIRWVPMSNIHLNLKFLGDVVDTHVDFLKQMLAHEVESFSGFEIQIGGLGSFPTSKRPRVLWIGLHAPAALASIQRNVESGSMRLGYQKEERPFRPHLTIGRVRQDLSSNDLRKITLGLESQQLGNIATGRVDSVHLFKSELKPTGPIYTKLFSAKLKTAPTSPPQASPFGDDSQKTTPKA